MKPSKLKQTVLTAQSHIIEVPVAEAERNRSDSSMFPEWMADEQTGPGAVQIRLVDGERILGTIVAIKGEESAAASQFGLPKASLEKCVYLSELQLSSDADRDAVVPLLLYSGMRRGRIWRRHQVAVGAIDDGTPLSRRFALETVPGARAIEATDGNKYRLKAQRLDYAMDRAFDAATGSGQGIAPEFLVQEILDTLDDYVERVWDTKYFRSVDAGTLARQQYVYMLSNMYQFVRFTTRLLGRAVGHSATTELRTHFIRHLQGEINHELIIERDLEYMGEDVRFVMERMVPNREMRQFMSAQESMIGFYHDPILLMTAPLAAEGVAGRLTQRYIDCLHTCVRKWGVRDPVKATRFYTSHIQTDGGEDGHFAATVRVLASHITDETILQRFLSVLNVTTEAIERGYDAFIDDAAIWSARCE